MQGFLNVSTAPALAATSCYAVLTKSIPGCSKEENTHLNTDSTAHGLGGFSAFTKDSAKGRETGFIMRYSLSKIARLLQNKRPLEISSICGLSEVIFNASSSCTACITNTVLQLSEL